MTKFEQHLFLGALTIGAMALAVVAVSQVLIWAGWS